MIKLDGDVIDFKHYNDGTLRLNLAPRTNFGGCIITWLYESDIEMSYLYFVTRHLRDHYEFARIILEMPYIPHARLDRFKENSEVFTLKYFCDFINSLHFAQVRVFDPHSNVSAALLNNVRVLKPERTIQALLNEYFEACLFFCDEGAVKRYKDIIGDNFYAFGVKDRDWSTQNINSLQVMGAKHMIAGHDILIVDDIISRGSTLYLASTQLKELGARNIYVWASHCENTVLGAHINGKSLLDYPDLITKIYTTNSIYTAEHEKIKVLKVFE